MGAIIIFIGDNISEKDLPPIHLKSFPKSSELMDRIVEKERPQRFFPKESQEETRIVPVSSSAKLVCAGVMRKRGPLRVTSFYRTRSSLTKK